MDTAKLKNFSDFERYNLHNQVTAKLALVVSQSNAAQRGSPLVVKKLEEAIQLSSQNQIFERMNYSWFNQPASRLPEQMELP